MKTPNKPKPRPGNLTFQRWVKKAVRESELAKFKAEAGAYRMTKIKS